jgi:hypothetical protein
MSDTITVEMLGERLLAAEKRIENLVDENLCQSHHNLFVMAVLRKLWDKDADGTLLGAVDEIFDGLECDANFEVHVRAEIMLGRWTRAFKEKYGTRDRPKFAA